MKLALASFSKEGEPVLKALLDAGCDVNNYELNGYGEILTSSLSNSIETENKGLFFFLLNNGAESQKGAEKKLSWAFSSPLHQAIGSGLVWAVDGLLKSGTSLLQTYYEDTVFHTAFNNITDNTSQILELLLEAANKLPQDDALKWKLYDAFYIALKNSKLQTEHLLITWYVVNLRLSQRLHLL